METYKSQILNTLNQIEGNGSFVFSNKSDFIPLGLNIKGVSEIGFPITATQIANMIQAAHKAPFGKGSKTIIDPNVRSAWEIDAKDISFLNPNWTKTIKNILDETKIGLGLENQDISASLYKLLIYEAGDFFLPHKDSEKEAGMFGTLIIGLPSKHTGGQLFVRFDGKEHIIDFSDTLNDYTLPYTAFYADCEHEIKPITSGHRVCLVYNLVQKKGQDKIQLSEHKEYVETLATLLQEAKTDDPIVILLGHEYTPTNFSLNTLKRHDRPRAEVLLQAAEKAGFYANLGLVTCYSMGDLEESDSSYGRGKRKYYDDDDEEEEDDDDNVDGVMGDEVYEEYIGIEHWSIDGPLPPLSRMDFEEEDIITDIELRDGNPTQKEAEGYTGNAGMTIEYWYHYGAVVMWHKSTHFDLLNEEPIAIKLTWLSYYYNNWQTTETKAIKNLLENITANITDDDMAESVYRDAKDFSPLAAILIKLNDIPFISSTPCQSLLAKTFNRIDIDHWVKLLKAFDTDSVKPILKKAAKANKVANIKHITEILMRIKDEKQFDTFVGKQIKKLPDYLNDLELSDDKGYTLVTDVLTNILSLSKLKNEDETWLEDTTKSFAKSLTRKYVNDVLVATLLSEDDYKTLNLAKQIAEVCKQDLIKRTKTKPTPPADWSREVPKDVSYNKQIWELLTPFLKSPTQQVFDYARVQAVRSHMESAIRYVTVDLRMETIKRGSPHTLRLIKTQAAFEKDLANWHVDVALLNRVEAFY